MSSSLVSVGSFKLALSRIRPPSLLSHCPRRVSFHPYPRLIPSPSLFLQRTFTATRWVQYARPSPNLKSDPKPEEETDARERPTFRENIYTIPNVLTASRILACPLLGWSILHDDFYLATGLLVYAGLSDLADGYLARRFSMHTVLGTILDPAADKALMTTLTVTLAVKGMLPLWLATIIIGRDALLSLSAFYIRYTTLPHPKTWHRYWDFSIPSAEVRPTTISKYNTAAQLALMFGMTVAPIGPAFLGACLPEMQALVAVTTVWSGLSYVFSKDAVRVISETRKRQPPSQSP
ncbi:CDP-alcohol phosphatidyltransferase-domain-containing protein [Boletus edulis BED1]|uniref:CDP-alcohol phosphatidyltransferase-domain-containing protein n=1 Tax=Boletus edulis BED1 TaxID=1328754 RepID=A0AAD4GK71_BOLED|nr:CDP-alcohol phosphatidyltransferase-domain-containing protein [Boletus edulis BED1]